MPIGGRAWVSHIVTRRMPKREYRIVFVLPFIAMHFSENKNTDSCDYMLLIY
ncbi:hypothetical protein JCM10003_1008 [Bacteroides pyogenes JCM 10003]|nr:hypothetical protein JCM10003_1008 [Bacteroides pyogenes JCM 10003]